jgi:hypothetical protein
MSLVLTAGAPPIFLGPNRINRFTDLGSDLVCSNGNVLRHRLYDMEPRALWDSLDSSEGSQISIVAGLWLPDAQAAFDIDFVAVLGHNLKTFSVALSADNGADGYSAWSASLSNQTNDYLLQSITATTANKLRLLATYVQAPGTTEQKQVGTIIAAEAQFQAPHQPSVFKRLPWRVNERAVELYNGSRRVDYVDRSDASFHFQDFSLGWMGLTDSEADAFEDLYLTRKEFILGPAPGDRPGEWFNSRIVSGTFTRDYVTLSRSGGWMVSFDTEEVGGA